MRKTIYVAIGIFMLFAIDAIADSKPPTKGVKLKIQAVSYPELTSQISLDLWVNGFLLEEAITHKKDRFVLRLDLNEVYNIYVNQPGCMTKVINVDTHWDGDPIGKLAYNIDVLLKKEVIDTFKEDEIFFHLFPGENNKTMLMLAGE